MKADKNEIIINPFILNELNVLKNENEKTKRKKNFLNERKNFQRWRKYISRN